MKKTDGVKDFFFFKKIVHNSVFQLFFISFSFKKIFNELSQKNEL